MRTYQVAVLIGSLRKGSYNRQLATALVRLGPPQLLFRPLPIDDLPLYNQDDDAHQAAPVKRFKADLVQSDAVLFVTPEYNRSVPGVLKNAIDHASRPYGQSAWHGKPAAIVGVSPDAGRTAMAQQHLRNILASLDMPTLAQPEVFMQFRDGLFAADGHIGAAEHALLLRWMERFAAWVERHARSDRATPAPGP